MSVQAIDDLPLLADIQEPAKPKLNKAEREWQEDWQRSQALRWTGIELGLRIGLRHVSLQDVQRMWLEENAKKAARK